MKNTCKILVMMIVVFFTSKSADAGFLDKLNAAAGALNQKTQQMKQGTPGSKTEDPDRPLHLEDHYKGSCEGKRSATCMDYGELVDQCMEPLRGYRMKVTGDRIEKKLKTEKNLRDKQRKNLEEDLVAIREAEKNKSDYPTIAGKEKSQRYLNDISEEDQVYINAEYNTYHQKIYNKCIGADHMGIGRRTEMGGPTMSGDEAVAELKKKRAAEEAPFECLKGISKLRWVIIAEKLEAKLAAAGSISDQERKNWEADIASVRDVATSDAMMPAAVDPKNPMRYMVRLSSDDQIAVSTEYATRSQEESAKCTGKGSSTPKAREVKKAEKHVEKKYADLNYGRGGSTNLLAMRRDKGCADVLKGNIPKLTADKLESKLKAAKGVSDQKRKEWEEDIAAFKTAAAAGVDSPEPPDPDNPYRWYDYVTNQERQAINKEHAQLTQKIMTECNSKPSGL